MLREIVHCVLRFFWDTVYNMRRYIKQGGIELRSQSLILSHILRLEQTSTILSDRGCQFTVCQQSRLQRCVL